VVRYASRREFLVTVPIIGCSLNGLIRTESLAIPPQLTDKIRDEIRNKLLELVNAERYLTGASELEFDDLASRVATAHAIDMATGNFVSHWGRDGRKPYHRYSFAGGIHATQENVASINNFFSADWKDLTNDLITLHVRMHAEKPPRDGHRKTILAPQHTHVGFGFATSQRRLRLVELYVAKYMEVSGFKSQAARNETLLLSGRLLNDKHSLQQIDIFYEPPAVARPAGSPPISGGYGLPDEFETLRPKLAGRWHYADGSKGVIELKDNGEFSVPIKLSKPQPGIYTIVSWVKKRPSGIGFPATEICVETE
jgi:cysteine-rich secretory family protein